MEHTWSEKDVEKQFMSPETGAIYKICSVEKDRVTAEIVFTLEPRSRKLLKTVSWPCREMWWLTRQYFRTTPPTPHLF